MSIIQEALKKAHHDYLENKIIVAKPSLKPRMLLSEAFAKPIHERKRSATILLVLVLSVIAVLALGVRFFFILTSAPVPKEDKPLPAIELVAPSWFGNIVHVQAVDAAPSLSPAPVPEEPFKLSGIMNLNNNPRAIINGYTLETGDTIRGATLTAIGKDYVLLSSKDEKIKVPLK